MARSEEGKYVGITYAALRTPPRAEFISLRAFGTVLI